jgi:hypothetical protein
MIYAFFISSYDFHLDIERFFFFSFRFWLVQAGMQGHASFAARGLAFQRGESFQPASAAGWQSSA